MRPEDKRRIKRRIKATLALGLGVVAGAFLACTRSDETKTVTISPPPPNPTTPDSGQQIVLAQHTRDAAVDRDEHRHGMPVPDNLLE
jgi:hypothetical protein